MININQGITAERVKAMREETGMGLEQCKRTLQKSNARKAIMGIEDIEDLRPILLFLLENIK